MIQTIKSVSKTDGAVRRCRDFNVNQTTAAIKEKRLSCLSVKFLEHPGHVTRGFCSSWQLDTKDVRTTFAAHHDGKWDMCQATDTPHI